MATDPYNLHGSDTLTATIEHRLGPAHALFEEQMVLDDTRGSERAALLARLLACGDVVAATLAAALAALAAGMSTGETLIFLPVVAVLWFAVQFAIGLYQFDTLQLWASGISQLGRISAAALLVSWPLAGIANLLGADGPVVAGLVASATALTFSVTARTVARAALHRVGPLRQRTVILGSGDVAGRVLERLQRHDELGLQPIGIVDDEVHGMHDTDVPVLGRIDELRDVLRRHSVDRVIIAFTRTSHEDLLAAMRACREERVAVDIVPRLFEFLEGARAVDRIGGLPVLSIGAHKLSRSSALAKRGLDIAFSALALLAVAPLLIVIAIAIKLESRGPVLFRQLRAGRGGKPFEVLKFRSMYVDADRDKRELLERNEMEHGVLFKMRADPRVGKVGGVLRRLSLDELPQLINVLRGDMSLVGPRPLVLDESEALGSSWPARRLDLRPGLTGPWQISGRSDLSVQDMVRLDFQYVTGWSLARDIEIILATVPAVLSARGAY